MKLLRTLTLCGLVLCGWGVTLAQTPSPFGSLTGIVSDPAGIKQMGATVVLTTEELGTQISTPLLTDQNGAFSLGHLRPGFYSVKASLAGFLPTLQAHVQITSNLTTIVHIELGSVFASLDALRQKPARPSEGDDWQWVLRTSAATRPVLHVVDDRTIEIATNNDSSEEAPRPRARVEMASGSLYPGSSSGLAGPPATAASYEQSLGAAGRVMMAGRMSYAPEMGANATFAGVWLPEGEFDRGKETVVVLRQAKFDAVSGISYRSLRAAHSERMWIGQTQVDYGMAYVMAGASEMSTSLRPHLRISRDLSANWTVSSSIETEPDSRALLSRGAALESALDALDTLPVMLWRQDGRSQIAGGWHYEMSVKRMLGERRSIEAATFRDASAHIAVFGFDVVNSNGGVAPPIAPYAHDGGSGSGWGSRVVYREKLANGWEFAAIYSGAGALAPITSALENGAPARLPDRLDMALRHSVAGRVSGRVPRVHTQLAASYKWINGVAASRQDLFGEAAMGVDPYLSLSLKQPLPSFRTNGHWEALADFRNVLSQGYLPIEEADGQILVTPVARSFRGGLSYQF